jgi:hypothetical protein
VDQLHEHFSLIGDGIYQENNGSKMRQDLLWRRNAEATYQRLAYGLTYQQIADGLWPPVQAGQAHAIVEHELRLVTHSPLRRSILVARFIVGQLRESDAAQG